MWCVTRCGTYVKCTHASIRALVAGMRVLCMHFHLEQFEDFKAEHANCDVSKVSAVSVGVHVSLWQQPHLHTCVCVCSVLPITLIAMQKRKVGM